jgi:hypothetical protein
MNTNYGYSIDVIKEFSGAPSKTYLTSYLTLEKLYEKLNKHKNQILIATSSSHSKAEVAPSHSYVINQ